MEQGKEHKKLSRRSFLGTATLAGAGLAGTLLPGCGDDAGEQGATCPDAGPGGAGAIDAVLADATVDAGAAACPDLALSEEAETWDEEVEVVVVGGGGAGLVAAITAAEAGAKVLLLEKSAAAGGATKLSGGVIQAAGTTYQEDHGIADDSPDKHYECWMAASEGWVDSDLVRTLADGAPEGLTWLAGHGVTYGHVYAVGDLPTVERSLMPGRLHIPAGAGENWKQTKGGGLYVDQLVGIAEGLGVETRPSTPVVALVAGAESGVTGVVAGPEEDARRIRATRGVVLASGGFGRSAEMAALLSPRLAWEQQTSLQIVPRSDTGDGIRMAQRVGAGVAGLGATVCYPLTSVGRVEPEGEIPGIWVNRQGQRFVNEAAHYGYVMREVYRQEGQVVWAVYDQHGVDAGAPSGDHEADTLDALAAAIEVPAGALSCTVELWNAGAAAGEDAMFHKRHGLQPLDRPPFRAVTLRYASVASVGGLRIDPEARVLDVEGAPIPRLYAAGMVAGGFIGPVYPGSGTAITATLVLGRIAGANAAAEERLA